MAPWVGAQGQVYLAKKGENISHCDVTHRTPNPKRKRFFSVCYRRLVESVEGLNNSLAQSAGEFWSCRMLQTLTKSGWGGTKRVKSGNIEYRKCRIRWGFEQFSSSIGWRVMELQKVANSDRKVVGAGRKGLRVEIKIGRDDGVDLVEWKSFHIIFRTTFL